MKITFEMYVTHVVERSVWELDNICYKRQCIICEAVYKLWGI